LRRFIGEGFANAGIALSGTRPTGRSAVAVDLGLAIEIIDIAEWARGERAVAHITDGALDGPFSLPCVRVKRQPVHA
jgi:hypothetical protein